MSPAVFLDKDGTLVVDVPYNVDPTKIQLYPGVAEALANLHQANYRLIVITNQSGVARGYFPETALTAVEQRLRQLIPVPLTGFYYCPHYPNGQPPYDKTCDCRKPQPGLLTAAAADHGIDLTASWMVGDILNDVEAGNRAGCCTILIDNGNETEWLRSPLREPSFQVPNFAAAAALILQHSALLTSAPKTL